VQSSGLAAPAAIADADAACVATSLQRAPLPAAAALALGDAIGRMSVTFAAADLVAALNAPPAPAAAAKHAHKGERNSHDRVAQGRRRQR
jgi:hypothetical protein